MMDIVSDATPTWFSMSWNRYLQSNTRTIRILTMRDAPSTLSEDFAAATEASKRVRNLDAETQRMLLFALIGRMVVSNPEGLIAEIEWAEKYLEGLE